MAKQATAAVRKGMPFAEYEKIDAVNWSVLKEMRRSPLHYHHRLENPREDSTRLALGRGVHTAVLEPDRFMLEYACFKGAIRRGKEWDAFEAQHQNETILKQDEYTLCLQVRDAVRAHPLAAEYLKAGTGEQVLQWSDATTQVACKGRVDWVSSSKPALVDVKTTSDIAADKFAAVAARMGYHTQGAFYRAGHHAQHGEVLPVVTIAVEIGAPHDVAVYLLDEDALAAGEQEWMRLLEMVAACRKSGVWPGRFSAEQALRLPRWAVGADEEDISDLDLNVVGSNP
jgi:hypothetical protein